RYVNAQCPWQQAGWPAGIDQEGSGELHFLAQALAAGLPAAALFECSNFGLIQVGHAGRLRFFDEELVEMFAEPVRVADLIARAGGDEQFIRMIGARPELAAP